MRILLLADVHANWEALLGLQRAEPQPDAVLFAGDALGYGPDPFNCVRWLQANATLSVRGNHDEAFARGGRAGMPPDLEEAAHETLVYAREFCSVNCRDDVGRWPTASTVELGGARFYLTHATPRDPFAGRLDPATCPEAELQALFGGIPADIFVVGHTHVPALRRFGNRLIVNPGSLGQPRYGAPDATYAVWEDGEVRVRHLHYDHETTARKLRLAPLGPEVTEQLVGILNNGLMQR